MAYDNLNWIRVTRKNPCPVCDHSDWCCLGEVFVNCMRVMSDRVAKNGGWLHRIGEESPKYRPHPPQKQTPQIDAECLLSDWRKDTDAESVSMLAESLGVTSGSLFVLGVAWSAPFKAWAFPMKNARGNAIGIRLRSDDGRKWAVTGSRNGLFIPEIAAQSTCYIAEGPTDTAALLSLGLYAVGRPMCVGCESEIASAMKMLGVCRVIIISDNDSKRKPDGSFWNPGLDGSEKLTKSIGLPSCVFVPPAKDIREFVKNGGTREIIKCITDTLLWNSNLKT